MLSHLLLYILLLVFEHTSLHPSVTMVPEMPFETKVVDLLGARERCFFQSLYKGGFLKKKQPQ